MMILCRAQRLTLSFLGFYVVALAVSFPLQLTTARDPSVATGGLLSTKVNSALECENNQATQVLDGNQAISDFLQGTDRKKALEDFHVHGWRWHTLSLSRDSGRLTKLAKRTTTANIDRLQKAAEYVVGFNLKGLHKIEADLFFPWMKEKLTSIDSTAASQEFGSVMDLLEDDRRKIEELGQSIVSLCITSRFLWLQVSVADIALLLWISPQPLRQNQLKSPVMKILISKRERRQSEMSLKRQVRYTVSPRP